MASNGEAPSDNKIEISVKGQDGRSMYFKVSRTSRLTGLLRTYCERRQLEYGTVDFYYNANRVNGKQTPQRLNMENGDEILAVMPTTGGGCCRLAVFNF